MIVTLALSLQAKKLLQIQPKGGQRVKPSLNYHIHMVHIFSSTARVVKPLI